jgi:hypothetical protein
VHVDISENKANETYYKMKDVRTIQNLDLMGHKLDTIALLKMYPYVKLVAVDWTR